MMSFATRNDPTYIAQLLGRMVRTPLQMRVTRDDFLNDVKLYLPHFNKENVKKVVDELQSNEGGEIPTEINGESLEEPAYITWTVHTPKKPRFQENKQDQITMFVNSTLDDIGQSAPSGAEEATINSHTLSTTPVEKAEIFLVPQSVRIPVPQQTPQAGFQPQEGKQLQLGAEIDRVAVIDFINSKGFLTYMIRQDRINDYLKSLLDLATLLTHNLIYRDARDEIIDNIVGLIRAYIDELQRTGKYKELATQVLQFKLSVQVFDPFGRALMDSYMDDLTLMSETDLDRQVRNANAKLGGYGFPNIYGGRYYDDENPNAHKIDCILFAADESCRNQLGAYAKRKLQEYVSKYRLAIVNKSDSCKKKYHDILADSDIVSEQIYAIPENIMVKEDPDGTEYENHLLASEKTGIAKIKMNGWESSLIEEESCRNDFVCWLRNPSRAAWALCLPYEIGGQKKSFYPDFLIVRSDPALEYVVDILEPHGDQYVDNLPKAKALAEYSKKEDRIGRIQLIHKSTDAGGTSKFLRLDLTDMATRERVLRANNNDEVTNIFLTNGFSQS